MIPVDYGEFGCGLGCVLGRVGVGVGVVVVDGWVDGKLGQGRWCRIVCTGTGMIISHSRRLLACFGENLSLLWGKPFINIGKTFCYD